MLACSTASHAQDEAKQKAGLSVWRSSGCSECHGAFANGEKERDEAPNLTNGVTGILSKPLNGKTLLEAIESLHRPETIGAILIVDDDPQTLDLYQDLVAQALPGHPIRTADGGAAAPGGPRNSSSPPPPHR